MLYKPPGAVYIASYKERLDQSDYWKLYVQLWNYTNHYYAIICPCKLSMYTPILFCVNDPCAFKEKAAKEQVSWSLGGVFRCISSSLSSSTKRKFLALDPTKWVETLCKFSLTQAHSRRYDLVYSTSQESRLTTDQLVDMWWNWAQYGCYEMCFRTFYFDLENIVLDGWTSALVCKYYDVCPLQFYYLCVSYTDEIVTIASFVHYGCFKSYDRYIAQCKKQTFITCVRINHSCCKSYCVLHLS